VFARGIAVAPPRAAFHQEGRIVTRRKTIALVWLAALLFLPAPDHTALLAQGPPLPTGWNAADVGDVGQPGSTSHDADTWTVSGAGADIWGAADAFHFAYTPTDNDADIYVRVGSEQPTHQFAKAGLMIRESLNPSADHVLVDVKPDGGIEVLTRRFIDGRTTRFVAGATASFPVWLRLRRRGGSVAVFMATSAMCPAANASCSSWTLLADQIPFFAFSNALVGMAVTSHDTSRLNSAVFDSLHLTQLTRRWSETFTYGANANDNARSADGVLHVPAAGADIWGTSDEFGFVYQTGRGDAEIVARVTGLQNTSPFAKAGVMLRANPGASAAHVILDVKPDGGLELMTRSTDGGATAFIAGGFMPLPAWLRLVRHGDAVDGYASPDGRSWALLGTTTLTLPTPDYHAGLAVTSHNPGVVNEAVFDNVSLSGLNQEFYSTSLLQNGGFEDSSGPALPAPWVSDRAVPATVESSHPHSGAHNAVCRSTTSADCGMYQQITVPQTGNYVGVYFVNADRPGALVGIDLNGKSFPVPVPVREPGAHTEYRFGGFLRGGDTLRVWIYSPANGGTVVVDDVALQPYSGPT
jgi:hypothetical protein